MTQIQHVQGVCMRGKGVHCGSQETYNNGVSPWSTDVDRWLYFWHGVNRTKHCVWSLEGLSKEPDILDCTQHSIKVGTDDDNTQ